MDEPFVMNQLAARYDASLRQATNDPAEAYADWRVEPPQPAPNPWPLH